jgi:hypothetical protein
MKLTNEGGIAYLDGEGSLVLQPIFKSNYGLGIYHKCVAKDINVYIDKEKHLPSYAVLEFRKKSFLRWLILKLLKL